MLTLALETSTSQGGVALFRDRELVFSHTFSADRSHSSGLFSIIEAALAPDRVPGRIVVGLGPGSYAGVRIAIAAAQLRGHHDLLDQFSDDLPFF